MQQNIDSSPRIGVWTIFQELVCGGVAGAVSKLAVAPLERKQNDTKGL